MCVFIYSLTLLYIEQRTHSAHVMLASACSVDPTHIQCPQHASLTMNMKYNVQMAARMPSNSAVCKAGVETSGSLSASLRSESHFPTCLILHKSLSHSHTKHTQYHSNAYRLSTCKSCDLLGLCRKSTAATPLLMDLLIRRSHELEPQTGATRVVRESGLQ